MKLSAQSYNIIESGIKKAMNHFSSTGKTILTDIFLQPRQDTGELSIFDDDDRELSRTVIPEWVEYSNANFVPGVTKVLTSIINRMKEQENFSDSSLLKPYSFVLVDEDKETISELVLIDDDTMLLNEELLKGLDEELDDFLKKLLED